MMTDEPEDTLPIENEAEAEPEASSEENALVSEVEDAALDAEANDYDLVDVPLPEGQAYDLLALETEGLDVDQALAAIASLNDMVLASEAPVVPPAAGVEDEGLDEARAMPTYTAVSDFPVPPLMTIRRGQMASVVPALLLIGIGIWLTLSLTTSSATPNAGMIIALLMAGVGVTFLAQWQGSGHWSRGTLFFGTAMLLAAGLFFWLTQSATPGLERGWPLLLLPFGLAFILTAWLSAVREQRQIFMGLLLALAGIAGYAVTAPLLDSNLLTTVRSSGPLLVLILLVFVGLPTLIRGRK